MNIQNSSPTRTRRTPWWRRAAVFTAVLALSGLTAFAQAPNTYSFAASSTPYVPLSGGTTSTAAGDDGTQTNIPIGWTFSYNGAAMTAVGITTNGTIRLGTDATTTAPASFSNVISTTTSTNTIAAMWDDNHQSAGSISYLSTGSSPSRVFTVCWTNVSIGGGGSTANSVSNYKIELFETTGVIRISYGAMTPNALTASIGITGATGNYISVTPAASPTTSTVTPNNSISAVTFLPTGTVYTFTPPPAPPTCAATYTPANLSTGNALTATLSWSGASGFPSITGYDVYFGTSPTPPQVGFAQAGTTYNPGTLICNTTYYYQVNPINAQGTTTCAINSFTTLSSVPACPATYTPTNAATSQLLTQTISWAASAGATGYNLYFDVVTPPVTLVSSNQAGLTYSPPGGLSCATQYYWRVEPINCVGPNNACTVNTFTTLSAGPGSCSATLNPTNAATGINLLPTLSWSAVTGATGYDVYFDTNPTPTTLVSSNQAGLTYSVITALATNTTYYWRIAPRNCAAANNTCVVRSFTTTATASGLVYNPVMNSGITYSSIMTTGSTFTMLSNSTDDGTTNTVTIPFPFVFNGSTRTGFRACTNGWLTFNTSLTTTSLSNAIGTTTVNTALYPFWDDLVFQGNPGTGSLPVFTASLNSSMRWQVEGAPGSQVLTVEWAGMERFANAGPNMNFQVKLYEGSNNVEFVYGTMEGFDGTSNFLWTYSVGMNGATISTAANGGPGFGEVIAQQVAREKNFGPQNAGTSNTGANALQRVPSCNTSILWQYGVPYSGNGPAVGAPLNENIGTAESLPVYTSPCSNGSLCGTYKSSRLATASGFATCAGNPDDDVWFTFTPTTGSPATGTRVTVRSYDGYDAHLEVFNAAQVSIGCVNATGAGLTETFDITGANYTVGATYYARVYHTGVGSGTTLAPAETAGEFSICVSDIIPPPTNDDCAAAILLTSGSSCTYAAYSSIIATASTPNTAGCGTPDDDLWFRFTPNTTSPVITVQSGVGYNAAFEVFSGTCGALTSVACINNSSTGGLETTTPTLTAGTQYYIRVFHSASGSGSGNFQICISETAPLCTTLSSPADNAALTTVPVTLAWTAAVGATGYDVYVSTTTPVPLITPVVGNHPNLTFDFTPFGDPCAVYYWTVVPRNSIGVATNQPCAQRSFTIASATCLAPTGVTAVANGFNSATVSFSAAPLFTDVYRSTSPVAPSCATVPTFNDITGSSQLMTGLTAETTYYVWVRNDCVGMDDAPGGDVSPWVGTTVFTGYCTSTNVTNTIYFINSFSTTGGSTNISNTGGFSAGGYGNFTAQTVSAAQGDPVGFSGAMTGGTFGFNIWVDWNNDIDFDDVGEKVYGSGAYVSSVTASFNVPGVQAQGNYRMRVRASYVPTDPSACGENEYAETEDYTFTVIAPPSCLTPTALVASTTSATSGSVSWTASASAPGSYDVYFNTTGTAPTGLTTPSYSTAGLTQAIGPVPSNTTVSVWVRSDCGAGDLSTWAGPVTFFSGYCQSINTTNTIYYINSFNTTGGVADISNPTSGFSANGYGDFTAQQVGRAPGDVVAFNAAMTGGTFGFNIWVDFNNDLDFADVGEKVYGSGAYVSSVNSSFTIPGLQAAGSYRMRVRATYIGTDPPACGDNQYAETEDYTLSICSSPTVNSDVDTYCGPQNWTVGVSAPSVALGSATIHWFVDGIAQADIPYSANPTVLPAQMLTKSVSYTLQTVQGCQASAGPLYPNLVDCAIVVDCAASTPLTSTHCYSTGDTRTWQFVNNEVSGRVTVKFTGSIQSGDNVIFWDGAVGSTQITSLSGTYVNAPINTSVGVNTMSISIQTDGSGSCAEGTSGLTNGWTFEARCFGCSDPSGYLTTQDPETNEDSFNCETGLFSAWVVYEYNGYNAVTNADATTVGYRLSKNNVLQTPVTGLAGVNGEQFYLLGNDFPIGMLLDLTLLHEDPAQSICNVQVANDVTVGYSACPPDNDDCLSAASLSVLTPGNCGATAGTTLGADMTGVRPPCAAGAPASVNDVWYTVTTTGFANLVVTLTDGSATVVGAQLFTACGTPVAPAQCSNDLTTAPLVLNNFPQGTYLVRVFTPLATPGTFSICITGTPAPGVNCTPALSSSPNAVLPDLASVSDTITIAATSDVIFDMNVYVNIAHTWTSDVRVSLKSPSGTIIDLVGAGTCGSSDNLSLEFDDEASTALASVACPMTGYYVRPTSPLSAFDLQNPSGDWILTATDVGSGIAGTLTSWCLIPQLGVNGPCNAAPSAGTSTGTASVCAGGTASFTNNAVNNALGVTYEWLTGPSVSGPWGPATGTGMTTQNYTTEALTTAGTYYFILRATCTATSEFTDSNVRTLVVNARPAVSIATSPLNATICSTGNVALTATGASSYAWLPATGLSSTSIANPVATPAVSTTYTVTGTGANTCTNTATVTVNRSANPTIASATATPSTVCLDGTSSLLATASLGSGTYCVPTMSQGCDDPDIISLVAVAGINNATGCDELSGANGYSNFTTPTGTLVAGSVNSYTVETDGFDEGAGMWIDYDQSGSFEASEFIFGAYAGTVPAQYTGGFTVPVNALNGATRLRVRARYATALGAGDACLAGSYGETEDYTVTITGGVDPLTYSWAPATFLDFTNVKNPQATEVDATTTYTVSVSNAFSCTSTRTVTLTMTTPPSAGVGTSLNVCSNSTTNSLTDQLVGATPGGTWRNPSNTVITANYNAVTMAPGTYSYTVVGTGGCTGFTDVSTVAVTEEAAPNAGVSGNLIACASSTTNDLLAALGTPDAGGVWTGPSPVTGDNFDATQMSAGTYTYTVAATAPCTGDAVATVDVSLQITPNAGVGSPLVICINAGPTALSASLSGAQSGGTWTKPGGGAHSGTFLPGTDVAGVYTYTKLGVAPCSGFDAATVNVSYDNTDSDNDGIINCLDGCDFETGTVGSVGCNATPGNGFTLGELDATCTCIPVSACQPMHLYLSTDNSADDVTYEVLDGTANTVLCTQLIPGIIAPFSGAFTDCCLPNNHCYRLRVTEAGGDGMVNGPTMGGYVMREGGENGKRVIDNTANFKNLPGGPPDVSMLSSLVDNGRFCLPVGNNKPVWQHCDKLDWANDGLVALVATEDPLVSASWNASAPPTDKGYEFWWFDPNGGYSFRRFRSHSSSDGYSPANATRACKVKINGWNTSVAPHLQVGVLYNVRIRARYSATNIGPFGPACQFKINPAAAVCPLVKLQDNPSNLTDYSCGVTRYFGGGANPGINMNSSLPGSAANWGNKLVANPPQPIPAVASANIRYQFRFINDGEYPAAGSCIIRPPQASPVIYLNWSTGDKLKCGVDYSVDVRVSLDNGVTWCVGGNTSTPSTTQSPRIYWGPVCTVRIRLNNNATCPVNGLSDGSSSLALENNEGGNLTMYPNPNRGDQLFISLSEVATDVNTVSVDIYDMTGKRVTARTIAVQDGYLKTALDLNGDLSGGMYLVNITAGDKTYTERLVIQP